MDCRRCALRGTGGYDRPIALVRAIAVASPITLRSKRPWDRPGGVLLSAATQAAGERIERISGALERDGEGFAIDPSLAPTQRPPEPFRGSTRTLPTLFQSPDRLKDSALTPVVRIGS